MLQSAYDTVRSIAHVGMDLSTLSFPPHPDPMILKAISYCCDSCPNLIEYVDH